MNKSIINRILNIALSFIIAYFTLFLTSHFLTPNLGDIQISILPNKESHELQQVTITNSTFYNHFYYLVYEDSTEPNWTYINTKVNSKPKSTFISRYLPNTQKRYCFFEGNKTKNTFTFSIKAKYSIGYMANKDHVFHLVYIVPYKLFFFPTFYYSKHITFSVDSIIT